MRSHSVTLSPNVALSNCMATYWTYENTKHDSLYGYVYQHGCRKTKTPEELLNAGPAQMRVQEK
jgi:hypothetical protein